MKNARRALALTILLLGATGAVACKQRQPDNRLVIVKALWGDMLGEHTMDVTATVAAMVKNNALEVTADPHALGEPAPFKLKRLVVQWSKDGVPAKRWASEGESIVIPANAIAPKPRLLIQKAVYGQLAAGKTIDVTSALADMVVDNALSMKPASGVFGDPAPLQFKQLRVDYTFDGVAKSKTGGEDTMFVLP